MLFNRLFKFRLRTKLSPSLNIFLSFFIFLPILQVSSSTVQTSGRTFYVDCTSGNDQNSGTGVSQAWRSLTRANKASMAPGDRLLLKRGCTWNNQRLEVTWSGNSTQTILIGAYGDGALPTILNAANSGLKVSGSYLTIENLKVHAEPLQVDSNCANQPYGYYQVGFEFLDGASYNTLRNSETSGNTVGIKLSYGAHHNKIIRNSIHDNHVLQRLDPVDPKRDLGAWGVLINGTDNEIFYNTFQNNNSWCSYGPYKQGNSVEIYAGQRNRIHHNTSINDLTFTELGGRSDLKAADNYYAYNLYASSLGHSRFLITSGAKDTNWGPSYRTTMVNNTVYLTAPDSQGIVCWAGCTEDILTLKNNIIWAEERAAFANGPFIESHNIFWSSNSSMVVEFVGFHIDQSSLVADPLFIDPSQADFRLQPGSPAIDAGLYSGWKLDLSGFPIPQGRRFDRGAFEFRQESASQSLQ